MCVTQHWTDRDAYFGMKAWYNNLKTGHLFSVLAGISGRAKELRTTYASKADALAAARAEWMRTQRGIVKFEITGRSWPAAVMICGLSTA